MDARDVYLASVGNLPPSIEVALAEIPEQLQGYLAMRNAVQDTGPLPQEMKSLIIGILDVATGNYDGALNHARAALAAGLPWEGLLQAYCLMWIVQGFASTWGNVGWRVIDALRLERAKETGEQPG